MRQTSQSFLIKLCNRKIIMASRVDIDDGSCVAICPVLYAIVAVSNIAGV